MSPLPKRKEKLVFKAQSNSDVLIELYGTITLCHFSDVTLDPLECKNIIRHLNATNKKIQNNLHYKIFTLSEDHYFQERLEQFQTRFTVSNLNKMYTGTFTFMPADKEWIYHPNKNPYQNWPAHHQYEVNLVSVGD